MERRQVLAMLAMAAVGLALPGCSRQLPTYRYRMTVEVETPEGLRSGSSVIEVRTRQGIAFPGPEAATMQGRSRGEGVAVDLGQRGTLFALLISPGRQTGAGGYAWALLPNRPTRGRDIEEIRENYRALKATTGQAALPADMYPMLVRFRDLSNPLTVEEVNPGNLAVAFGPGVRLRGIFVEITDDPLEFGIVEEILPWLNQYWEEGRRLNGKTGPVATNDLADNLGTGAFRAGAY